MVTIKVGIMPGEIKEIGVEDATQVTVKEAFELANLSLEGNMTFRVAGDSKEGTDVLGNVADGTLVIATKKIKGN